FDYARPKKLQIRISLNAIDNSGFSCKRPSDVWFLSVFDWMLIRQPGIDCSLQNYSSAETAAMVKAIPGAVLLDNAPVPLPSNNVAAAARSRYRSCAALKAGNRHRRRTARACPEPVVIQFWSGLYPDRQIPEEQLPECLDDSRR